VSRFVSASWVAAGMIGLTVPNGCRELSRMVERPSQRAMEQHVLAQGSSDRASNMRSMIPTSC